MNLDFCITLSGPIVGQLWKLFWASLRHYSDLTDCVFYLVNKDIPADTVREAVESMQDYSVTVYDLPYERGKNFPSFNGDDVAYTCDFMMRECGTCKWACISHFDMWFNSDWLGYARSLVDDDVAIIGNHCPIMLINREAYSQTKVGFATGPNLDTGQSLQIEMRELGWRVIKRPEFNDPSETDEAHRFFHHIGGGGSHYFEPEIGEKIKLVNHMMREFNYK